MPGTGLYDGALRVSPQPELIDLVPTYLARRQADVDAIERALVDSDFEAVKVCGHSMKGSGGGYGFDGITEIGARLESAGRESDALQARLALEDLQAYLRNLEVIDV